MKRTRLIQLLVVGIAMMATIMSCSDGNNESNTANNPLVGSLVGSWYGELSASGETTKGTNSVAGTYDKVVRGLEFKEDGTGTYTKFLCNIANEPLSIFGGQMDQANGRFHYTSNTDGTVSITLDGNGDAENPKKWTMRLAENGLSSDDGGTEFLLKTADESQKIMLANWEETLRSGGNSEGNTKSFLKNWPNCETVLISGIANPQYLPWAKTNPAKSDIPENILFDINPANGWEMAFCCLGDPNALNTRYFGLYNRLSGVLRVYMFIPDAQAYGNEMAFEIASGSSGDIRYPFYNAMAYCIPADKPYTSSWQNTLLATGTSRYTPFSWCQTPYTEKSTANGVSTNWHCFDIDMSGYNPNAAKQWRSHISAGFELLSVKPISQNTSQIKLTGKLAGNLSGSITAKTIVETAACDPALHRARFAMGGIGSVLSGLTTLGGTASAIKRNLDENITAGWWGFGLGLAGLLSNTVGTILSGSDGTQVADTTSGTIDLNLDASIDITGTMTQWNSLTDGGMRLTPALLDQANPQCHIGEGCIGLQQSPVIYISKEDLLSEYDHAKLVRIGDMYQYSVDDPDLRFVAFLDPSTVKLNLNTNIYTNIKNVNIRTFIGVDASRPVGYSDTYRQLIGLSPRPTFHLGSAGEINLSTTEGTVRLTTLSAEDLFKNDPICYPTGTGVTEEMKKNAAPKWVSQTSDDIYRYYGSAMEALGSYIVVNPQAYLPFNEYTYKTPTAPDFVVGLVVTFDCDQKKNVKFIKQYLPEFKLVTRAELKKHLENLKDYSQKSKNGEQVGTLANNDKIPVYDKMSYYYLNWTLKMLEEVLKTK